MVALLTGHARLLSFGLLTAFSSSIGQTFFLALTVPYLLHDLDLGEGRFGLIYAAATLASGLTLPAAGRLMDRYALGRYTLGTLAVLTGAAVTLAMSTHVVALALALLGLRLAGQGLLGHISQTTMARDFVQHRGKALGLAGLGYPLGEALLPTAFVLAVTALGWRGAWLAIAAVVVVVVAPVSWWLSRSSEAHEALPHVRHDEAPLTLTALLRDRHFRLVLPAVIVTPLVLTALFLYQGLLGQTKGWSAAWLASAFVVYAASRALATLAVGPIIDRFTARTVLPLHLLPLAAALATLALGAAPWVAVTYFVCMGLTAGASGSVLSALWAELYGPSRVAAVRSVTTGLTVVSTAISPAILGVLLERGVGFSVIQAVGVVLACAASVAAWVAMRPHPANGRDRHGLDGAGMQEA
jgi:MFS family permease